VAQERKRSGRTGQPQPKAKGAMGASKPRKAATKSPPRAGSKAMHGAREDNPAESASRHIDQRASIPDPSRLFNSSLEGHTRRAIDIHEGEKVDAGAFKTLVKAAVAQNLRRR